MTRSLLKGPITPYRVLVYVCASAIVTILFLLLITINNSFLTTVPARGGMLTEGVIGAPSTLNPILATTPTDKAVSTLIFAGLLKTMSDGSVVPELAESYSVSPDGTVYTFILRKGSFSNGKPFTSADVAFTISLLQNTALNTNQALYWGDVEVQTPNESTVSITLPAPRTDFLQRATIGIVPEYIWKDVAIKDIKTVKQNNIIIGAGPFKIATIEKNNGTIQSITFKRNTHYILGAPLLKKLRITVYDNQLALLQSINAIDITSQLTTESLSTLTPSKRRSIRTLPTNTQVALYHVRGDGGALANASFVTVLKQFIDKEKIIAIVENGYGEALENSATPLETVETAQQKLATLGYTIQNGILTKNGVNVGISIATTNDPQMVELAQTLATEMRSLGIIVSIRNFDQGFFQTELEQATFNAVLLKEITPPSSYEAVIPLYKTTVPFVVKTDAHAIIPSVLISPVLRYANVNEWYTNTDKLYSWFIKKETDTSNN